MRIRRRPPQIPGPASSDPAAGGGSSGERGTGDGAAGPAAGIGEIIMGTGGLHPTTIEARGKGWRSWGGDSVSWRRGQPGGVGGGRGGSSTGGASGASCYGEVQQFQQQQQMRHKGKVVAEEEDGSRGSEQESQEKDQKPGGGAAQPTAGAHKTWNPIAAGGCAAAANGLGADAFASATGPATRSPRELASAARKRKICAWSSSSSRSARSPSSSSSSVKTEVSTGGGGITSSMHAGDRQAVKDDEGEKKGEEKQHLLVNGRRDNTGNNNSGKQRRSPAVLMEGSRCSRVNGRGWRCFQQTLVGYSLCEHHLGKGRLRSVSSVRCKKAGSIAAGGKQPPSQPVSTVQQLHGKQRPSLLAAESIDDDEDEEEMVPAVGSAHRGRRIGVVKARSISSLLGQTCSDVVDHAGAIHEAVAPEGGALSATSAGLPAAVVRSPIVGSTPASAAAAGSLPPPAAAHQEVITAFL